MKKDFRERKNRPSGRKPNADRNRERGNERPERKSYGRKPYRSEGDESDSRKKSYSSDRRSATDRNRERGDERPERKSYGRKPYRSEGDESDSRKKSYSSDRRSGTDRNRERGYERPERKSYGRKPYRSEGDESDSRRKSYTSDRRSGSYRSREQGDERPERKSFREERDTRKNERRSSTSSKRSNVFDKRGRKDNRSDKYRIEEKGLNKKRRKSSNFDTGTASTPAEEMRLNKFLSNAGLGSRREMDELISAGMITVNGNIVSELGSKIKPGDIVKYNNETVRSEKKTYVLLNKPKDYITTTDDPDNRKTVMELVEKAASERIYPVGRLDRSTTGLLLFTNDGELATRLMHPSSRIQKIYQVELNKPLPKKILEEIQNGIELEDGIVKVDEIAYDASGSKKNLGIKIHEGRNRVIRRIFEHFDFEVAKLDRVIYAGLTKKDLPRGRWRHLSDMEVNSLHMMAGVKKPKHLT